MMTELAKPIVIQIPLPAPEKQTTTSTSAAALGAKQQIVAERFKTKQCRNFAQTGECPYKERCMFYHGDAELRTKDMNIADGLISEEAIKAFRRKTFMAAGRAVVASAAGAKTTYSSLSSMSSMCQSPQQQVPAMCPCGCQQPAPQSNNGACVMPFQNQNNNNEINCSSLMPLSTMPTKPSAVRQHDPYSAAVVADLSTSDEELLASLTQSASSSPSCGSSVAPCNMMSPSYAPQMIHNFDCPSEDCSSPNTFNNQQQQQQQCMFSNQPNQQPQSTYSMPQQPVQHHQQQQQYMTYNNGQQMMQQQHQSQSEESSLSSSVAFTPMSSSVCTSSNNCNSNNNASAACECAECCAARYASQPCVMAP